MSCFMRDNYTKAIVVDSDAIFAIYNPNDPLNKKAIKIFEQLSARGYNFIYSTSVLFEIVSLFQRVLPTPVVTAKLIEMIKDEQISIYIVDADILREAAILFDPMGSKKNTLIDCSVAVIAKKIKAIGVFSFDSFYKKQGLKSASEL